MTEVYAHRGLHTSERENTLGAFRAAVALGVTGVELDVRQTLDGELVVHHDPMIGDAAITGLRSDELPSYVATLAEVLDVCQGVRANVEIKNYRHASEPTYDETGAFASSVVQLVRDAHWTDSVIFSCFDFATCEHVRSLAASLQVGWLLDWSFDVARTLELAQDAGFDAVHPHFRRVDATMVLRAHDLGLAVNAWTPNERGDLATLVALGADGVITDDPATALDVVRSSGQK